MNRDNERPTWSREFNVRRTDLVTREVRFVREAAALACLSGQFDSAADELSAVKFQRIGRAATPHCFYERLKRSPIGRYAGE